MKPMIPIPVTLLTPPLPPMPTYPKFDMRLDMNDDLYPFIMNAEEDMDYILMKNFNIAANRMVRGVKTLYKKRAIQHQASEWADLLPQTIQRKKRLAKAGGMPAKNVQRTLRRTGDLDKAVREFDIDVVGAKGRYFLIFNDAFSDVGYVFLSEFGIDRTERPFIFEGLGNIQLQMNQAIWQYEHYLEQRFNETGIGGMGGRKFTLESGASAKARSRHFFGLQDILAIVAPSEAVLALGILGEVKGIASGREHFNVSGITSFVEAWLKGMVGSKTVVRRRIRRGIR